MSPALDGVKVFNRKAIGFIALPERAAQGRDTSRSHRPKT
jgi:hypothetical protein